MTKQQLSIPITAETPSLAKKLGKDSIIVTTKKPMEKDYRKGKKALYVEEKKGTSFDTCATIGSEYVCCNVKVLKSVTNCPFDCSYCFLQNYLTNGTMSAVGNTQSLIEEVKQRLEEQPWRFFRIGTWELGDSLALEKDINQASELIMAFKNLPNAVLELKTKSDCVDTILDLDHGNKTVVSWSINPAKIIDEQEHKTASLQKRLAAMKKVEAAGYPIGLHFDPMIYYPEWEADYHELIDQIFDTISPKSLAWVSVGSLRFNPEMKQKMALNFPKSYIHSQEMILGPDGKIRYVKPLRLNMYKSFMKKLNSYLDPQTVLYFCMERFDVWEKILGYSPRSIGHLDYIFADKMRIKYPEMVETMGSLEMYEAHQDS